MCSKKHYRVNEKPTRPKFRTTLCSSMSCIFQLVSQKYYEMQWIKFQECQGHWLYGTSNETDSEQQNQYQIESDIQHM